MPFWRRDKAEEPQQEDTPSTTQRTDTALARLEDVVQRFELLADRIERQLKGRTDADGDR